MLTLCCTVVYVVETVEQTVIEVMMKVSLHLLLVVMVSLSLSDAVTSQEPLVVKSNALTHITHSAAVHTGRYRRQAQPLTPQQLHELIDIHNILRALEGADNMELVTWNDFLASMAEKWAAGCDWKHGQPPLGDDPDYTSIGQNLYATTGSRINLTAAILAFYNEKRDYNYDTLKCTPNKVCGHYTQVVWATSRHIGCAYHRCQPLAGLSSAFSKALYLVCNYGPPGNYAGAKPFTKGPACSKCGSGAGWCKDKLCNSDCSSHGEDCTCAVHCYNCASWDVTTCRCSCADGWRGVDCSVVCRDTHRYCNKSPGWPPNTCGTDYVQRNCPAMCKNCTSDPDAVADQCPPIYGPGAYLSTSATFVMSQQMTMTFVMITLAVTVSNNAI